MFKRIGALSVLAAVLFACGGSLTATPTPAAGATETPGGGGDLGSSGSGTDIVISLGTSS